MEGGGILDGLKETIKETLEKSGLNFNVANLVDIIFK